MAGDHQGVRRIRHKVAKDSRACCCGVSNRYAERLVNRLSKVDAIILIAAKEERLVLLNWASHLKARLHHSDQGLWRVLRVGKKIVGVQSFVTKEHIPGAMKFTGAASRCHRDGRSTITTFFGGRIVGRNFVFLNVIRSQTIQIADRIRNRRFIRFNSIDRHVVRAVARAINVYARTSAAGRSLDNTWFEQQEVKGVASIQR